MFAANRFSAVRWAGSTSTPVVVVLKTIFGEMEPLGVDPLRSTMMTAAVSPSKSTVEPLGPGPLRGILRPY